jgi:hypothetical protein
VLEVGVGTTIPIPDSISDENSKEVTQNYLAFKSGLFISQIFWPDYRPSAMSIR